MNIQHWFKKKVANWGSDINRLWKLLSRFGFAQTIVVLAALVTLISFFVPASSIHTFFSNITRPLIQNPLPHADPNRFSIAVAHLENDTLDQQSEKLLIEALRDFEGVQVLRVDRTIKISKGNIPEDAERAAEDEAKEYLRKTGADVLIWGTVLVEGDKVSPKLWWTISSDIALSKRRDIYMPTNFRLPQLFWTDLVKVIQMLVERQVEIVSEREGVLQADKLKLYIDKVSKILEVSDEKLDWREEDRARTSMILAASLFTLGEETRKNRPIARAITACREALRFYTLDKTPYEWGATNSILGGHS